jgi:molybdopterin molybdotransferase
VIGFPGNPVSTIVCAVVFLLPVLARLCGQAAPALPVLTARCAVACRPMTAAPITCRATLARRHGDARAAAGQLHAADAGASRSADPARALRARH